MVDLAYQEGWRACAEGLARASNPYARASPHDRLADMRAEAWRLGWVCRQRARELDRYRAAMARRRQLADAVRGLG